MTAYEIIQAPTLEVLGMLVESYVEQGYAPAGGLLIDNTEVGKVYVQAVFKTPQPEQPLDTSDWTGHNF